ncbi:hypothetical protein VNO78_10359 [Psophocarpus tetragonolobus]|uniref:Uncharacterized protein n=1 Tax=Psophocarpus tetragonolobus TaxID=3891 RepID=A0AAN9SL64_PSOTE
MRRVQSAECRVQSTECRVQSAEKEIPASADGRWQMRVEGRVWMMNKGCGPCHAKWGEEDGYWVESFNTPINKI